MPTICMKPWTAWYSIAIERRLARRHLSENTLVLCTSSYVEGDSIELASYGYNRDGKKGKQVFGLVTDLHGYRAAVEVFSGNTADPQTRSAQVTKLRTTFGFSHGVLVGDRGLLTPARLREDLRPAGLDWITALRKGAIRRLVAHDSLRLDTQDRVEVRSDLYPDERIILCRNPVRAEKSARDREALLARTEEALQKIVQATQRKRRPLQTEKEISLRVGRVIGRYKMAKHLTLDIREEHFQYARNEVSIQAEAALDGVYALRTSLEDTPDSTDVVAHYKRLSKVETAFRALKSVSLRVRPIHHRKASRVTGHVFLCMLACYVEYHLRKRLAPLLFAEDDPDGKRTSVVAPALRSYRPPCSGHAA